MRCIMVHTCNPSAEETETGDLWGSQGCQSSPVSELQGHRRVSQEVDSVAEDDAQGCPLPLYVYKCTRTTRAYTHKPVYLLVHSIWCL